jgi:hypothetical protein
MNTRKLVIPAAIFMLLGMFTTISYGCWNVPQDKSTGNFVKEERTVGNFTRLEIGGAFKVYLAQGSQEKLVVEADAEEIKEIITEVTGNKLKIYTKSNWPGNFHEMNIYITFKDLDYLDFSGAVEVVSQGLLSFSELEMDVSGATELDLEFNADRYEGEFSGASEIDFRGICKTGYFELSGASELDASGMEFTDLTVEVSGASDARVWATGTLTIDASGASDIKYKGSPKVTIDESGASTVKPM